MHLRKAPRGAPAESDSIEGRPGHAERPPEPFSAPSVSDNRPSGVSWDWGAIVHRRQPRKRGTRRTSGGDQWGTSGVGFARGAAPALRATA